MFVITFATQEMPIFRNVKTGEIVVGAEDRVEQCHYAAVITRVEEDLDNELTGGWKIIEVRVLILEHIPGISDTDGVCADGTQIGSPVPLVPPPPDSAMLLIYHVHSVHDWPTHLRTHPPLTHKYSYIVHTRDLLVATCWSRGITIINAL